MTWGVVLLAVSYVCNVIFLSVLGGQTVGFLQGLVMTLSNSYGIASTMVWCGVPLYCVGRLLEAGPITLVGFEKIAPSQLLVKGPDEAHTVWVGRTYPSSRDAEVAAHGLRMRIEPAGRANDH